MYKKNYRKYKKRYLHVKNNKMNTFLVKTETVYLGHNIVEELLLARGNWKPYDPNVDKNLTFLYIDSIYMIDPKYYYITADIRNIVDEKQQNITHKNKLYDTLHAYSPEICEKYMMKQYLVTNDNYKNIDSNIFSRLWIIKPIRGFGGTNNAVLNSYDNFISYMEKYKNTKVSRHGYVLDEYITNPLLIDSKKFDIRIHFIYYKLNGKSYGYIYRYGDISISSENFKLDDFTNKNIHDTNMSIGVFPEYMYNMFDKKDVDNIFEQIKDLFYHVTKISNFDCYKEVKKACYHCFSADLGVTTDYKLKIYEINGKSGLSASGKHIDWDDYYYKFFYGQLEVTIDRFIKSKNKVEPKDYYIDVSNST